MNEETIVRYSRDSLPKDTKTDWARLKAMTEEEIEANALSDPDNPPIDVDSPEFRQRSAMFYYPRSLVQLNVDPDTLAWFRELGEDFRMQMGAVLQSYMKAHEHTESPSRKLIEGAQ